MDVTVGFALALEIAGFPVRLTGDTTSVFQGAIDLNLGLDEFLRRLQAQAGLPRELRDGLDLLPADLLAACRLTGLRAAYSGRSEVLALAADCTAGTAALEFRFLTAPAVGGRAFLAGLAFHDAVPFDVTPLFGPQLAGISLEDIEFAYATADLDLVALARAGVVLPGTGRAPRSYVRGLNLALRLRSGDAVQEISVDVAQVLAAVLARDAPLLAGFVVESEAALARDAEPAPDPALFQLPQSVQKWVHVGKSFGPLHVERVGVGWEGGEVGEAAVLLDAALTAGPLGLGLQGFAVRFKPMGLLDASKPVLERFRITVDGLNAAWEAAPLAVAGAFLREPGLHDGELRYSGAALIKLPTTSLAAVGSYGLQGGVRSLFILAALNQPLGGTPFFFVTGLAAGFGYNMDLRVPPPEDAPAFPLVAIALAPDSVNTGTAGDTPTANERLGKALALLQPDLPPAAGQYWAAAGVKFSTYQLVRSLALLVVRFGRETELALLGRAALQLPTPKTAFISAEMGLVASFRPAAGTLEVAGRLTENSYILDKNARPTGGFAFSAWFKGEHAGDFVLTIGGYAPGFDPPAWYPAVPRVGFGWQVSNELSLTGQAYFALTPSAIIAGAQLQGIYQSTQLRASFDAAADFLLGWRPFRYDVHIPTLVRLSGTADSGGTVRSEQGDVELDLHLAGPPMHGELRLKWWVFSVNLAFGAPPAAEADVLSWRDFRSYFLPSEAEEAGDGAPVDGGASVDDAPVDAVRARVTDGLIGTADDPAGGTRWLVDADRFTLAVDTAIPLTRVSVYRTDPGAGPDDTAPLPFAPGVDGRAPRVGIRPMAVTDLDSELTIEIERLPGPGEGQFTPVDLRGWQFAPQAAPAPAALWSPAPALTTNANTAAAQAVLSGVWMGLVGGHPPRVGDGDRDVDLSGFLSQAEGADLTGLAEPSSRARDVDLSGFVNLTGLAQQPGPAELTLTAAVRRFAPLDLPLPRKLARFLAAATSEAVVHLPTGGALDLAALAGIQTGPQQVRLAAGMAAVWDAAPQGPPALAAEGAGAHALSITGELDVRVTCLDAAGGLLADGASAGEHPLPPTAARIVVTALAPARTPRGQTPVAGWLGGSVLLQAGPHVLLGEGVVLTAQAPYRPPGRAAALGPATAADVAAANRISAGAGRTPGWLTTTVPPESRAVLVFVVRDADEGEQDGPVMKVWAEGAPKDAALSPAWTAAVGDRVLLAYRLPEGATAVRVTPPAGWLPDGVLALPLDLPAGLPDLPRLHLPARAASAAAGAVRVRLE